MIHNLRHITRWNSLWRFNCSNHWVINFKTHMSPTFLKRWSPLCQIRPTSQFVVIRIFIYTPYLLLKNFHWLFLSNATRMWADAQYVMADRLNIGGALCESSAIPFLVARRKFWLTTAARVPCSNAANIGERKTWDVKCLLQLAKFRQRARAPKNVYVS